MTPRKSADLFPGPSQCPDASGSNLVPREVHSCCSLTRDKRFIVGIPNLPVAGVLQDKGLKAISHSEHDPGKLALGEQERVVRNPVSANTKQLCQLVPSFSLFFNRILFLHEIGSCVRSTPRSASPQALHSVFMVTIPCRGVSSC